MTDEHEPRPLGTAIAEFLRSLRGGEAPELPPEPPLPTHAERQELGPQYEDCFCRGQGGTGQRFMGVLMEDRGKRIPARVNGQDFATWSVPCTCPDGVAHLEAKAAHIAAARAERRTVRLAHLQGQAGIPKRFLGKTVDSWAEAALGAGADPQRVDQTVRTIAAWRRAVQADDGRCLLVLGGNWGCGKSGLGAALAQEWIAQERAVLFRTILQLVADLAAAPRIVRDDDTRKTEQDVLAEYQEVDLLVLDDIGSAGVSPVSADQARAALFAILDTRLAEGRPTIVTTDQTEREVTERFGGRLADRLSAPEVAHRVLLLEPNLRERHAQP